MRFFGHFIRLIVILMISIIIFSCSKNESKSQNSSLVIYSPSSRDFIDPLIEDFKSKNPNIEVEVIIAGTGELIKRIETEKNDPLCDVLMAANINLVKNNQDLFENYTTTNENEILDSYKNVEGTMTRFMISPSVLIVNTNLVGNINIEGYSDLINEHDYLHIHYFRRSSLPLWLSVRWLPSASRLCCLSLHPILILFISDSVNPQYAYSCIVAFC